ncbi:hypothetical protein [Arthrobacter castelli]|uniref:hypothetical protein n=1 Tax=Arthrobacter castelli TaxID=271431 RepID=UPI0003F81817|nr:hypothetical protein [Arthrobacter castelli]
MASANKYVRYQAALPNRRGTHPGVFALVNGLAKDGELSSADLIWWRESNDWCNAAYPDPGRVDPSIYDSTVNPVTQAWFKSSARHLLDKVDSYLALLHRYSVECEHVMSDDPGRLIYEDEFQIVVVPH